MTKEEIKKAAKVMLAYAQGESIQRQDPNGNWVDCVSPTFDWGSYDYRVKPKMPKADEIERQLPPLKMVVCHKAIRLLTIG